MFGSRPGHRLFLVLLSPSSSLFVFVSRLFHETCLTADHISPFASCLLPQVHINSVGAPLTTDVASTNRFSTGNIFCFRAGVSDCEFTEVQFPLQAGRLDRLCDPPPMSTECCFAGDKWPKREVYRSCLFAFENSCCSAFTNPYFYSRAIDQGVSRRLPPAVARVRAQVRSCGIYGEQSGT
jgi:hypothetical protein